MARKKKPLLPLRLLRLPLLLLLPLLRLMPLLRPPLLPMLPPRLLLRLPLPPSNSGVAKKKAGLVPAFFICTA